VDEVTPEEALEEGETKQPKTVAAAVWHHAAHAGNVAQRRRQQRGVMFFEQDPRIVGDRLILFPLIGNVECRESGQAYLRAHESPRNAGLSSPERAGG